MEQTGDNLFVKGLGFGEFPDEAMPRVLRAKVRFKSQRAVLPLPPHYALFPLRDESRAGEGRPLWDSGSTAPLLQLSVCSVHTCLFCMTQLLGPLQVGA